MIEDARALSRREARKRDRRQTIVDAARECFLERGYAGASMSGLLSKLGGSKGTLWSYFRSKEELFAAVVEDTTASFRAELATSLEPKGDLKEGIVRFCTSFLRTLESPQSFATWRLIAAESGRFPEIGRIFHDRVAKNTEDAVSAFLAYHMQSEELRCTDSREAAELLISLCTGRQHKLLWGVEKMGEPEIERHAMRVVEFFLAACAK